MYNLWDARALGDTRQHIPQEEDTDPPIKAYEIYNT